MNLKEIVISRWRETTTVLLGFKGSSSLTDQRTETKAAIFLRHHDQHTTPFVLGSRNPFIPVEDSERPFIGTDTQTLAFLIGIIDYLVVFVA